MEAPRWPLIPLVALMVIGFVVPCLVLVAMSVTGGQPDQLFHFNLDFSRYEKLNGGYFGKVILSTMAVSAAVATITSLLAYPVALFLARSTSRFSQVYFVIVFTPVAVGMNMLTLGWMLILGRAGLLNSVLMGIGLIDRPLPLLYNVFSVIVGLVHVTFTFSVLPIEAVIRNIDPALEKAARNLGASRFQTFLRVTLPLSLEGVSAGFLIVFMQTCGAFVLPLLLGGQNITMLPVAIWEAVATSDDRALAAVLSVVLLVVALLILFVQLRFFTARKALFS